jgi:hypothetical protein
VPHTPLMSSAEHASILARFEAHKSKKIAMPSLCSTRDVTLSVSERQPLPPPASARNMAGQRPVIPAPARPNPCLDKSRAYRAERARSVSARQHSELTSRQARQRSEPLAGAHQWRKSHPKAPSTPRQLPPALQAGSTVSPKVVRSDRSTLEQAAGQLPADSSDSLPPSRRRQEHYNPVEQYNLVGRLPPSEVFASQQKQSMATTGYASVIIV